jgi:hypothetical protein
MNFKLSEILESTILTEGRKEDAMKKYGASKELVDKLSASDPSGNNKYLMWMVGQVMGAGEGDQIPMADAVSVAVERFHKQVNRFNKEMADEAGLSDEAKNNPKDINVYKDINELLRITKVAEKRATDKDIKREADKVYEDENILVLAPLTVRASCKYGSGTRWCITGGQAPTYNSHFDSYSKNSVFYFITNKNMDQRSEPRLYKYALQYYHDGRKTWWDAQDSSHNAPPSWFDRMGSKAMDAINAYQKTAAGEKLKREIKKFLLQPTSRGYATYREHLSDEEKKAAISRIITNEGSTVQVLESLVKDLTEKQKNALLHNLTGLTNSTFNKVKDQLNNQQLMNVIKNNPVVLNNSDSVKYVDEVLSDDQKYGLAHSLDKSKVSNTDSKVVIRKWSMTEEERAKHNQYSQYVFLLDTNKSEKGIIEKLIKVDSLNPESYKIINGLKLRATMDRALQMYAIKTEAGILDDMAGRGGDAIDPGAFEAIMERAVKI